MFTELTHADVEEAVRGFIAKVKQLDRTGSSTFHVLHGSKVAHIGPIPCKKRGHQATLDDVWTALRLEMKYMFFVVGDSVRKQKQGLGIGGILSPFGACALCMYFEDKWQQRIGATLHGPIRGARMVDDLLMVVHVRDHHILPSLQTTCYPATVELEQDCAPGVVMHGLECEVRLTVESGVMVVSRNKNEGSLLDNNTIRYVRYPHWHSYHPARVKSNFIHSSIDRMTQNTAPNSYRLLAKPLLLIAQELHLLEYPWGYLHRTFGSIHVHKLPVQPEGMPQFKAVWGGVLNTLAAARATH